MQRVGTLCMIEWKQLERVTEALNSLFLFSKSFFKSWLAICRLRPVAAVRVKGGTEVV